MRIETIIGLFALGCALPALAQPVFDNPSPTAGSDTSHKAHQMADRGLYREAHYPNAAKQGPTLIVIPGEIKSNNATFTQKFGPNNIADFAELELGRANFRILERADLGPLMQEFQLAYTMGDPNAARRMLQKGKLKNARWVVKFDVLKAEPVAQAQEGFDGQALGSLVGILAGGRGGAAASTIGGAIRTSEATGVWIVGMRYKILDANTTEQVATGYSEEKMELGAQGKSILGVSSAEQGGLTLDALVQRLVQKLVWDIDTRYK